MSAPATGHQGPQPPQPTAAAQQYPPYPGRYSTPPGPGHGSTGRQPFPTLQVRRLIFLTDHAVDGFKFHYIYYIFSRYCTRNKLFRMAMFLV